MKGKPINPVFFFLAITTRIFSLNLVVIIHIQLTHISYIQLIYFLNLLNIKNNNFKIYLKKLRY